MQTLNQKRALMGFDYAAPIKESLLRGETKKIDTKPGKVAAAIAWMGRRYVCHKSNRVKKLAEPLPPNFQLPAKRK